MTLPLNDRVTSTYTADGTNKEFNFDFRVFFNVDTGSYGLEVRKVIDGGYEVLSSSLYTVVPNEDLTAGKIVFATAPVAGTEIYLAGKTPTIQQLNLTNYGRFSAEAIEVNFDFLTAIVQEWLTSLSIERAERIENDLLVNANTAALYAQWQEWAETNVPGFAATYLNAELADFKQEWIDALNAITSSSIPAIAVPTSTGQNQQQVNDAIGAKWYSKANGYNIGDRVTLTNGTVVRSTAPLNTNNPNSNMTGWTLIPDSEFKTWTGATQEVENKAFVTTVANYAALDSLVAIDGRVVYVKNAGMSGEFKYVAGSVKAHDGGTVIVDSSSRRWERVDLSNPNIEWWGVTAAGSGATNQAGYAAARDWGNTNKVKVNLNNKTYNIDSSGASVLNFINGSFNKAGVFYDYDALGLYSNWRPKPEGVTLESQMLRMNGAAPNATGFEKGMIAIGPHTMQNATTFAGRTIAIGMNNMITGVSIPELNIAIGDHCMIDLNNDGSHQSGTRNIAIGQLTLQHLSTGKRNTAIGRNSAANVLSASDFTCLGYCAGTAGTSTLNSLGDNAIQEGGATTQGNHTAIGSYAGAQSRGDSNTFLGAHSGENIKSGGLNTIAGSSAGAAIDVDVDYEDKVANYNAGKSGTYTNTLGVVVATLGSGHGIVVGNKVGVALSGSLVSEFEVCTVTAVTSTTITFNVVNNTVATGSGTLTISLVVTNTTVVNSWGNALYGSLAMNNRKSSLRVVAIGFRAHECSSAIATKSSDSVVVGSYAGGTATNIYRTTVIGHGALGKNIAGAEFAAEVANVTAIGYSATVSGDNQVQLGNSSTTTYVYGTVQNRSDIRDKTDIEPMPDLMTQFILELNPVQGRWDMREDYTADLFPLNEPPVEPQYPDKPLMPNPTDFVMDVDGVTINRTDLYEDAFSQYMDAYQVYESEYNRMKAEHDAARLDYENREGQRNEAALAWWSNPEKDGSKKRTRLHNWFIAQEVKALAERLGIDFAGLQDHNLINGTDTLSIGYEEFIPPIVATIQKLSKRMDEIEQRLNDLEN